MSEETVLNKINKAMKALGSDSYWKRAPKRKVGCEELSSLRAVFIDDASIVLEMVLPDLIAHFSDVRFVLYSDQKLEDIAKQILGWQPDVVLVDYYMKSIKGDSLVAILRDMGYKKTIIGFSSDCSATIDFLKAGANSFVDKMSDDIITSIFKVITRNNS